MDANADAALQAQEWLNKTQGRWRLQTLQYRGRYDAKTGKYKRLPTRIRRFLNGTPAGIKSRVLELLEASAPYSGTVFDLETDDSVSYMPTNTFIRKDGPEHTTNGRDATYTIIQDLRLSGESDLFGLADESSCSRIGESEYHWDEPDVVECPDGGQGVSYQIANVSRDRDTDLFSYQVRKTQALTQHRPAETVQCDGRRRTTTESWDNVYGEAGSYRWDPVKGGSVPIELPVPCEQPDGTSVTVNVTENPDCTFKIEVQRTYAVTDPDSQFSIYRDQYKTQATERVANAFAALPKAGVEYSGGTTTRYTSEHNEDGTWTNTTERETERPVQSSVVERRMTIRGTVVSRTDANQAAAASGISTQFGSFKSTKTPGGRFNNEYVEYVRNLIDNLGMTCTDTAFSKMHETQSTVESVVNGHVPAASGGLVTTWVYETDPDGFVTRRIRTEQEHTVNNAEVSQSVGWLGIASGFRHRSITAAAKDALLSTYRKLGYSVKAQLTNGAMWDVEVQGFVRTPGQPLGMECEKTIFQHSHETVSSAGAVGADASDAGNGQTHERRYAVDPANGAVTARDKTVTELKVADARRTVEVTSRGVRRSVTTVNSDTVPADPSSPGRSLQTEKTPGGRTTYTETSVTPRPGVLAQGCAKDAFTETDTRSSTSDSPSPSSGHTDGGSNGQYRETVSRLGDDGLWENQETVHKETPNVEEGVEVQVTSRGKRKTTRTRSKTSVPAEPGVNDAGKGLKTQKTRGGYTDVEETEFTPRTQASGKTDSKDLYLASQGEVELAENKDTGTLDGGDNGVYRERVQRLGDDGLWEINTVEHTERAVPSSRIEERVTRSGLVRRTTHTQGESEGTALTATVADIGKERTVEKTRGGKRNLTTTEVVPIKATTEESCQKDAFLETHSTRKGVDGNTLNGGHASDAGSGKYYEKRCVLNEAGVWEEQTIESTESNQTQKTRLYQDAFSTVETVFNNSTDSKEGDKTFTKEQLIKSVEQEMTRGKKYSARVTSETPHEVDSGWLHYDRTTSEGLSIFYDFIVFRNATIHQVKGWITALQGRKGTYSGGYGSYEPRFSQSISPNKFRLWDGYLMLMTEFRPKNWAAGGNNANDNYGPDEYQVVDMNFSPMTSGTTTNDVYILVCKTAETHLRGGGVGKDKLRDAIRGKLVKGSMFSYHPSGQSFQYDIITAKATEWSVVKASSSSGFNL